MATLEEKQANLAKARAKIKKNTVNSPVEDSPVTVSVAPTIVEETKPVVTEPKVDNQLTEIKSPHSDARLVQLAGGKWAVMVGARVLRKGSREKCAHSIGLE